MIVWIQCDAVGASSGRYGEQLELPTLRLGLRRTRAAESLVGANAYDRRWELSGRQRGPGRPAFAARRVCSARRAQRFRHS